MMVEEMVFRLSFVVVVWGNGGVLTVQFINGLISGRLVRAVDEGITSALNQNIRARQVLF